MKIKSIRIGKTLVGEGHKCYVIAEIGSNFDGSLTKAKKLIKLVKDCGANAAKFQSFKTEELLSKKGFNKKSAFQSKWKNSVWDTYRKAELPRSWHEKLASYAKKIGIDFFTSPWDFEAVDILDELDAPAIKVGSGDITYHKILEYIARKNRPILLSTGASNIKEISSAVKKIKSSGNNKIILLHSVVQYPSPIKDANLKVLETLKSKFGLNVGYSDHSPGILIPLTSVALGACVIEKHFTINQKLKGPDHPHSLEPPLFREMIKNIRIIEKALGDGVKRPMPSEKQTIIIQRRGIWTTKNVKKGDRFSSENIKSLRPVFGLSASYFDQILGKKAKKNYHKYEPIKRG